MSEPVSKAYVGQGLPRLEGRAKVSGAAPYIYNLRLPQMLHAKLHRSSVAHGRIVHIDTRAARALPGVHAVFTAQDFLGLMPDPYFGPAFHDQPILALDKVRYIGEPVAAVLAADPHVAEEAAALIEVHYEELPAVFDEVQAMSAQALVHEELRPAGTFPDLKHLKGRRGTNLALDFRLRQGDVAQGFAQADHVFEHHFKVQPVMHVPLEPMVSLAEPDGDGVLIHSATQMPSFVRLEIARLLGWSENQVRVKTALLGGGFGAKVYIKLEALATVLALLVRRPVRVALTMQEQFFHITNHAATLRIKSGLSQDGRLMARQCEVWWNGGAYADIGPRIAQKSGFTAAGPYAIDHVQIDSYAMYTHLPPAGAMRGFGVPQLVWAYESHMDMIARALKIDPLALRERNILREGMAHATGTVMRDTAVDQVLAELRKRLDWDQPLGRGEGVVRRGRGLAVGVKASISPTTSVAMINVSADGSATLYCNTVDMGQGSNTAMSQIAAQVLGIAIDKLRIVSPDTAVTPFDMGTLGSRSTFHMGHAVRLAAEHARQQLQDMARELGLPLDTSLPDLFRRKYGMSAGNVVGTGTYTSPYAPVDPANGTSPNITPNWMIGGTGVEVEVDTETGQFQVTRLISVGDAGQIINPRIVASQLSGAAIMAMGGTLTEEMVYSDGQLRNGSLAFYKIPGTHDIPPVMENAMVESSQTNGPFGAKGVGESGSFAVAPAIANAIEDAVGVRLTELPLTAEAVLRALRQAQGRPLAKD